MKVTRIIDPDTFHGVQDIVNENGQLFFVCVFEWEGVATGIHLPLDTVIEMERAIKQWKLRNVASSD